MNAWTQTASCGAETLKHAFSDMLLFIIDIKSHFCMNSIWQDIVTRYSELAEAGRKTCSSSYYLHACLHDCTSYSKFNQMRYSISFSIFSPIRKLKFYFLLIIVMIYFFCWSVLARPLLEFEVLDCTEIDMMLYSKWFKTRITKSRWSPRYDVYGCRHINVLLL